MNRFEARRLKLAIIGSYGEGGMETFRTEISLQNICLAVYEEIKEYASDVQYEALILKMNAFPKAKVIVCFCYGETIRGLLRAINKLHLTGRFIIVGRFVIFSCLADWNDFKSLGFWV